MKPPRGRRAVLLEQARAAERSAENAERRGADATAAFYRKVAQSRRRAAGGRPV